MEPRDLGKINIETFPRSLFKSDVDYFLLYFFKNGPGAFNAAKRSLERHTGHRKCTMMGYTESRHGRHFYRGTAPWDPHVPKALWWRPFDDSNHRRFSPTGTPLPPRFRTKKTRVPFQLTARGLLRAEGIYRRVDEFLDSLVRDLVLEKKR